MAEELNVHDIHKTEVPDFSKGGIGTKVQVTFFVGRHGPFTKTYDKDKYSDIQVRQDIQKEKDSLMNLQQMES